MELFHRVELFADAKEFDRLTGDGLYRKCRTATSVGIELRQDHSVEFQAFVKFLGRVDGILARHCIDGKVYLVGLDRSGDIFGFLHHIFVDVKSAGGIDNHYVVAVRLGVVESFAANADGVFLALHTEKAGFGLAGYDL